MARTNVIISDATNVAYDGNLSTTDGFYQVEAWNWSCLYTSGTLSTLTTYRALPITFANAGVLQGNVILLSNSTSVASVHTDRNITQSFQESLGACTIDISTDYVTRNTHGLNDGDVVAFSTTGTLPTGILVNNSYFVINKTANTFQLSATSGGAAINMTGANGSGHILWVQRDTKTMSPTDIMNTSNNSIGHGVLVPIKLTTPYTVDTNASKWRFTYFQSGGTTGTWQLAASAAAQTTSYVYAAWCNTQVTATDNDTVIQMDPINIDCDFTAKGVLGSGRTDIAWAWTCLRGTDPTVANVAKTTWDTSASRTLTVDGWVIISAHAGFRIGTSGSKCTLANQAILNFPAPTIGTTCGFNNPFSYYSFGRSRGSIFLYGETPAVRSALLANDTAAAGTATMTIASPCVVSRTNHGYVTGDPITFTTTGALPTGLAQNTIYYINSTGTGTLWLYDTQENAIAGGATGRIDTSGTQSGTHTIRPCLVTNVSTGWSVGQTIAIGGMKSSGTEVHGTKVKIAAISGTVIATDAGMTIPRKAGHSVACLDAGYGIKFIGNATARPGIVATYFANVVIDGVECNTTANIRTGSDSATLTIFGLGEEAANRSKHIITNCTGWQSAASTANALVGAVVIPPDGLEISNNICAYYGIYFLGYAQYSVLSTFPSGLFLINNNLQIGTPTVLGLNNGTTPTVKYTFTNNVHELGGTGLYGVQLLGLGCTISGNKFYAYKGATLAAMVIYNLLNSTGSGNYFDNCTCGIELSTGNTINNVFTDNIFGSETANTYDIRLYDGILFGWQENSPTGAVTVDTQYLAGCAEGSMLKMKGYNDTAGDIRSWQAEGTFTSATDKIVGRTIDASLTLTNRYRVLTEAVAGFKIAAFVNCQIANAAYYAGTYVLPKLTMLYDLVTTEVDTATASTASQELAAAITPTTSYNDISISLSQKTDATGANADVTWDTLQLVMRKFPYRETALTKVITEATNDPLTTLTTPVVNPFITVTTEATVAAYTGISINHATQTCTISSSHTLAELFDYSKYDIALEANLFKAQWFDTIDGVNFTSTYDIVVNNCTLSGSGKRINMPTRTFTLSGTGATDITINDTNGVLVSLTISGLQTGTEVHIYKTSDQTELAVTEGTAGSTFSYNYNWTEDVGVYITILKEGYQWLRLDGQTLKDVNQTIPVQQQIDRTFVNPA